MVDIPGDAPASDIKRQKAVDAHQAAVDALDAAQVDLKQAVTDSTAANDAVGGDNTPENIAAAEAALDKIMRVEAERDAAQAIVPAAHAVVDAHDALSAAQTELLAAKQAVTDTETEAQEAEAAIPVDPDAATKRDIATEAKEAEEAAATTFKEAGEALEKAEAALNEKEAELAKLTAAAEGGILKRLSAVSKKAIAAIAGVLVVGGLGVVAVSSMGGGEDQKPDTVEKEPTDKPKAKNPAPPPVRPTKTPVRPTPPPVQPTKPPVLPTKPPVLPTKPPVRPNTPEKPPQKSVEQLATDLGRLIQITLNPKGDSVATCQTELEKWARRASDERQGEKMDEWFEKRNKALAEKAARDFMARIRRGEVSAADVAAFKHFKNNPALATAAEALRAAVAAQ